MKELLILYLFFLSLLISYNALAKLKVPCTYKGTIMQPIHISQWIINKTMCSHCVTMLSGLRTCLCVFLLRVTQFMSPFDCV